MNTVPRSGTPVVPHWKRCLDLTLIVLAVPMMAPVMGIIALIILSVSRGPVIFRQTRVGAGGKLFECLKFRTMHVDADTNIHEKYFADLMKSNAPMTKLDQHDSRLIPSARLLRASGLDELPQLINVLRGEMSLVGPRPSTPKEYAALSRAQRNRTNGLPGLTGLWQVSGKSTTTFSEMIELDMHYLQTQCLSLDLNILFRTPMVLVTEVISVVIQRSSLRSGNSYRGTIFNNRRKSHGC